ncbi:MAG TPA: tetratricopeptide repeat protein [Pyrinomonadaceae bacterium]|jgi:tetratricopeptide (TPR) repeat protein
MNACRYLVRSIGLFFLIAAATIVGQAQSNSITGHVFDAQNRFPVGDLYVELLDSIGMNLGRTRIDSSGGFTFRNLRAGTFQVKVLTFGTNYKEEIQEVQLTSFPLGNGRYSSDIAYVDVYLKLDPRKINVGSGGVATVVFVQEIPDEARKLYKKAIKQLEDKKDEGLSSLKQAIEIFPTYYDALDLLGTEYVRRQKYEEAAPYLIKAIDVNQRSFSSFYALGLVSYNLKNIPAAVEALRGAITINPQSITAQLFYGMVLRISGDYGNAEKALLQAKSLSQKSSPVAEIYWQLGLLYEKQARYKEAAESLEKYLDIEPKSPNAEKIKRLIVELRAKAK